MKSRLIDRSMAAGIGVLVVTVAGLASMPLLAEQGAPGGDPHNAGGKPSKSMLQACVARKQSDSCSIGSGGAAQVGMCHAPEGLPLACITDRGGPNGGQQGRGGQDRGGPAPDQSNAGSKVAETQANTLGVLCGYSGDALNSQIGLTSRFQWRCADGVRRLTANGIPDHPVGDFPNRANPNRIAEHPVDFVVTTSPVVFSGPGGRVKEPVMGLNGIKFDPGTGGRCPDDISNSRQCGLGPGSPGQWAIEALGQSSFDFGTDANHAHVQPGGAYHYHGVPDGMLSAAAKAGKEMAIIGWAADGFPVYARYGYPAPGGLSGKLKLMRPSYRLKSQPDADRPSAAIVPMGAFSQDWEYVAGLGDLDQCNGRFGATPEFPAGIYHYYATDAYPYVQRCVMGATDNRPQKAGGGRGGPPRGGGPQ